MSRVIIVEHCPDCPYVKTSALSIKLVCTAVSKPRAIPRPVYPIGKNKFPEWCPLEERS